MSKELIERVRKITIRHNISGSEKITLRQVEESLQRNVPMKVKRVKSSCGTYRYVQCPNCNTTLPYSSNYCGDCGQALDWGTECE